MVLTPPLVGLKLSIGVCMCVVCDVCRICGGGVMSLVVPPLVDNVKGKRKGSLSFGVKKETRIRKQGENRRCVVENGEKLCR